MKIILEVVATNMDTGHIAINHETVELAPMLTKVQGLFIDKLRESQFFEPKKVGPILIARSFVTIA